MAINNYENLGENTHFERKNLNFQKHNLILEIFSFEKFEERKQKIKKKIEIAKKKENRKSVSITGDKIFISHVIIIICSL